ncbi:unnamed protein product [Urochloa decumbens]|uniref:Pectinesterase inhibitor domain-containing protein n=1 Tax=Urochloa decumbens TaxID=240449 RepID=A0ABC8ZN18_9POAL
MATTMTRANPNSLLAVLLCAAASVLPGSSAAAAPSQLISQTCSRTSNERLCIDLLQSSNRSATATSVRDLAVVAVTAARRSALRARILALELSRGARGAAVAGRLAGRCAALYADCLRASARAVGRVSYMPEPYDEGAADTVSALRRFPEECEGMFSEARVASPLEKVSREVEERFGVAAEIVRLLG